MEVVEKLIAGGAKVDVANKFGLGLRSLRLGISLVLWTTGRLSLANSIQMI